MKSPVFKIKFIFNKIRVFGMWLLFEELMVLNWFIGSVTSSTFSFCLVILFTLLCIFAIDISESVLEP